MTRELRDEVLRFDPELPIERAATPPASWYRESAMLELEQRSVFGDGWIAVGLAHELASPGAQLAVELAGRPLLLVRREDGALAGYHNACRHHGTLLLDGHCRGDVIRCGYHGWTYGLDGRLLTAPRMAGVEGFRRDDHGLRALACTEALGLLFVHLGERPGSLPPALSRLQAQLAAMDGAPLHWHERRSYPLACNWKVFVDNYLDGGYHVEHLHPELAGLLDLDGYRTEVDGEVSVQSCAGAAGSHRVGARALYAFVHPNLMLNRYGRVLDVNRVLPTAPDRCEVVIDWAFEEGVTEDERRASLEQSEVVQQQDVAICEAVQRGMASPGYGAGCYAPRLEQAAHGFHRLLARRLRAAADAERA